jgi:hypothetical protein
MKQHRGYRFLPRIRIDDKTRDYIVVRAGMAGKSISEYIRELIAKDIERGKQCKK